MTSCVSWRRKSGSEQFIHQLVRIVSKVTCTDVCVCEFKYDSCLQRKDSSIRMTHSKIIRLRHVFFNVKYNVSSRRYHPFQSRRLLHRWARHDSVYEIIPFQSLTTTETRIDMRGVFSSIVILKWYSHRVQSKDLWGERHERESQIMSQNQTSDTHWHYEVERKSFWLTSSSRVAVTPPLMKRVDVYFRPS